MEDKAEFSRLIAMMADILTNEMLVDLLSDKVDEYKRVVLTGTNEQIDEAFNKLSFYCIMVIFKTLGMTPDQMYESFKNTQRAMNLLNPNKQ